MPGCFSRKQQAAAATRIHIGISGPKCGVKQLHSDTQLCVMPTRDPQLGGCVRKRNSRQRRQGPAEAICTDIPVQAPPHAWGGHEAKMGTTVDCLGSADEAVDRLLLRKLKRRAEIYKCINNAAIRSLFSEDNCVVEN
jgi:hypothetical protein